MNYNSALLLFLAIFGDFATFYATILENAEDEGLCFYNIFHTDTARSTDFKCGPGVEITFTYRPSAQLLRDPSS